MKKAIFICKTIEVFPIRTAIRLPIVIGKNTKIGEIHRGNIILNNRKNNYRVHI